jgi:hypothetical protein
MASPERAETRLISQRDHASFKSLFQEEVHHVNYEVTHFPTGQNGWPKYRRAWAQLVWLR